MKDASCHRFSNGMKKRRQQDGEQQPLMKGGDGHRFSNGMKKRRQQHEGQQHGEQALKEQQP